MAANAVNIALNATFVLGLGLGLAGSASGTVIAQTAGACVYLTVIARGARRAGVGLAVDRAGLRTSATAAAGLIVRTLALQVALVVTTAVAARQGNAAIAAHQIAFRIWILLTFALDAVAIAGQAITGALPWRGRRGRGPGRHQPHDRLGCGVRDRLLPAPAADPAAAARRCSRSPRRCAGLLLAVLVVAALQQPVSGVVFVLDGVLIGAGDQNYLAWAGVVTLAVYLPAVLLVPVLHGGLVALWLAYSLWLLARFVTLVLRARGNAWLVTGAVRR